MTLEELVVYNIKRYRKLKQLSQEKLAEKSETSTSYIGLLETGKNIPKLSTIERIAKALDVEPHILFISSDKDFKDARKKHILNEIKKILDSKV